ncbi:MAG TPA: hypothetical protein VF298_01495 [Bacteroidales bacterium]
MKKNVPCLLAIAASLMITSTVFSQTKEKIGQANAKGKVVFLAVTDGKNKLPETMQLAALAQKKYPKSEVVSLDKSDKANAALVTKYGLAGTPAPLILVLAANGVAGGGYALKQATPENLVELIPTKNQAKALLAFSEGKPAFIVLYKKSMKDKAKAVEECNKAVAGLHGKASVVDVDLEDKTEAGFLSLLKPEMTATTTHILVFNAKGQFTDEYKTSAQASALITSSAKVIKSSCCPAGSGSSGCAPK